MKNIMDAIKKEAADTNLVETENGALGFAGHRSDIVDFFYKASSMRSWNPEQKVDAFDKAVAEDKDLAYRMLFFLRDIRGGMGERKSFRDIVNGLPAKTVVRLLPLIPTYGRWDDVLVLLDRKEPEIRDAVYTMLRIQWNFDLSHAETGEGISLLGKWLPSIRKVSEGQVKLAKRLCRECFRIDERSYRKGLSKLRAALRVVERDMTLGKWSEIHYPSVPSKAGLIYRNAFLKHDEDRRRKYLESLEKGETKINAGALFPHEIVARYGHFVNYHTPEIDRTLEEAWKALPVPAGMLRNAIVVRDGSGSMTTQVSGKTTALHVATALAILMSEHLRGPFKDRFITFGEEPKFVDLSGYDSLNRKVGRALREADCSNTDIEKTMKLILDAAVNNGLHQEDIPAVVIISDMEFDEARGVGTWRWSNFASEPPPEKVLFERIREQWAEKGFKLPKMVFWNVASRTGAVPMQENENGLLLVSGFSQNILDMLQGSGTMIDAIRKKLNVERYDAVSAAIK